MNEYYNSTQMDELFSDFDQEEFKKTANEMDIIGRTFYRFEFEFIATRMIFEKLTKKEQKFIIDYLKLDQYVFALTDEELNIYDRIKLKMDNNGKMPKMGKEFWQMTSYEFSKFMGGQGIHSDLNLKETHRWSILNAKNRGDTIPQEVMNEYPGIFSSNQKKFDMKTKCDFKNKTVTKTQLINFEFRFIKHVTRDLYEVINAKEWAKKVNATKPHYISKDSIAFWTDDCCDHAYVLNPKDILPL